MIPPSDPQGDAARLDAEYIVRQLGEMSPELKQRFVEDFSAAFWSALRGYALPDGKNFTNVRILSNGSEVTTNSGGTVVGMTGGKSQYDILNFKGSSGMFINSASNARQIDINVGGGGADCMFDVIVSPCFSSLAGWAEGTSYTSLSGCTFYGYTTVQAALNKAYALGSARTVYVCHGSYTENVDTPNFQVEINFVGAGCDAVKITGASSTSPTFKVNTIASGVFNISNMTLVGNGNNNVLTTVLGYPAFVSNLRIRVKSGGIGWTVGGLEIAQGVDIEGADSSETGILAGTAPVNWLSLEGVQVKDCNIGVNFANIRGVHMEDSRIISCATGILMNANRGAYDSTFTDILFDTCTTGISFLGNGALNSKFTGNTFLECNTGIDLTGAFLIPPDTVGMRGSIFSDNKFHTTTASFKGFNATRASLNQALTYCLITDNTFTGYTSGNEFFGTDNYGTGTQIFHNVSDAGALADFGSVVGHSSTGSGTAAPSAEPFVTIGNSANLSAERALTAGNGVGFTDGGANSTVTADLAALTADWTQSGAFDINSAGKLKGTSIQASGLTGAVAASRYVGATASGAPASGTFAVGDFIIDQTGAIYVCTVAGTPGTWVAVGAGGSAHNILSATHSDTVAQTVSRGSIVYGNSTPKWDELTIGASGKFLRSDGTDASWQVVADEDVSTTGMKATILLQGWQPTTTAGCADPAKSEVGSTDKHDIYACAFDSSSAESAFLHHAMPDNWDGSTVTFRVWWFSKTGYVATSSDGVAWTLKATAYGDGDAIDTAYGTGVTVTDTETADNQARKTADSSALTIGNSPSAGDLVHWVLTRTVSDGADDLAADAYVIGVVVEYGVSALSS